MILLDTHAWIWWLLDRDMLSRAAEDAIAAATQRGVCVVSCWEVAMLTIKGRLGLPSLPHVWIEQSLRAERVEVIPLSVEAAVLAATLPMHGDPVDRFLVASAKQLGVPLVTKDEKIRASGLVQTIW